eukprot:g22734.t1
MTALDNEHIIFHAKLQHPSSSLFSCSVSCKQQDAICAKSICNDSCTKEPFASAPAVLHECVERIEPCVFSGVWKYHNSRKKRMSLARAALPQVRAVATVRASAVCIPRNLSSYTGAHDDSDPLGDRRHAKEDEWFRKKDLELLNKLRKLHADEIQKVSKTALEELCAYHGIKLTPELESDLRKWKTEVSRWQRTPH